MLSRLEILEDEPYDNTVRLGSFRSRLEVRIPAQVTYLESAPREARKGVGRLDLEEEQPQPDPEGSLQHKLDLRVCSNSGQGR